MEEDQIPEEIPMDQVLAEIRQMLSQDTLPAMPVDHDTPNADKSADKTASLSETKPAVSSVQAPEKPDYFLLTPAMRCDLPRTNELSETVQRQTEKVLNKLQQQTPELTLSPALEAWLNENLPAMLEKALAKTLKK